MGGTLPNSEAQHELRPAAPSSSYQQLLCGHAGGGANFNSVASYGMFISELSKLRVLFETFQKHFCRNS